MKPFTYQKARSEAEALAASSSASQFLGGGTNLLDLMKKHIATPDKLVDVNEALSDTIEETKKGIRIGAAVKNTALATNPIIQSHYPLVAKAILQGASPQIRNMATTAGNMMQRTRCPYFYDTALPCNKREKGSGCGAIDGNNHSAAIIGYSNSCVAVHPSDLCVALAALDAEVEILLPSDSRQHIAFTDFHRLPGNNPEQDNHLPEGAMITAVTIPANKFQQNSTYLKLRERTEYAFALISVAAGLQFVDGQIQAVRLASGGVAHKPWRWYKAEEFLHGKEATEEVFAQAASIVIRETKPLQHNGFKVPLLKGAIETALMNCVKNEEE